MFSDTTSRKRPFRTIGARLTLWSAGVMLCVCVLLCGTLYIGIFYALRGEVDRFLEGEVHEFMVTVNEHPNDDPDLEEAIRLELGGRTRRDLAFRLFDEAGNLIVSSEPKDSLAGAWSPPADWNRESPYLHYETVQFAAHPHAFRLCSLRVMTLDGRTCTAQAGYMLDRMYTSLSLFRRVCAIALVFAVLLAVAAGRFLATRSLQPVQTVIETAQRIGVDSITERIPLAGTDDELDRLAMTLNNMLDRIERHVRQTQQFTADASHELRSPLAALRGSAEVALTRSRSTDELRHVIEESIEHYDRLARIAENLLLLTRADAGQQVLECEPVRFDKAVQDVVDLYTPLAQERGVDLIFSDRAEIEFEADGTRLRQLVGNLIDNAIKYTGAGGHVTVSLAQANGMACLRIGDTGQGIPAEHLPRILDRFYRVDQSRSTKRGGAGLGLAICRMVAEAHGGKIDVSSVRDRGTDVTVTIPLVMRAL